MPLSIRIGQSVGAYRIEHLLGQGGMAVVYLARDLSSREAVAIKFLNLDALPAQAAEQSARRFDIEARQLAQLHHRNIVRVLATGYLEQVPYLVMDYLPGGTLKDRTGDRLPWWEAVRLVRPLADALELAHQRGVIHRDVKPANILLAQDGTPVLSDFGIAKTFGEGQTTLGATLTATGAVVGTPEYMAPEQAKGAGFDHRIDIYALGIVLYELVTGRRPFTADTPIEVLVKHVTEPLPKPRQFVRDLPRPVESVILRALAKKPAERFSTMAAFGQALDALVRPAPRPSVPNAGWLGAGAVALAGVGIIGALSGVLWWTTTAGTPAPRPTDVPVSSTHSQSGSAGVATATQASTMTPPTPSPIATVGVTQRTSTAVVSQSGTATRRVTNPTPTHTVTATPSVSLSATPIPRQEPPTLAPATAQPPTTAPPVPTTGPYPAATQPAPTHTSAPPPATDTSAPPPATDTSAPPP